jgi:hypothetical protein
MAQPQNQHCGRDVHQPVQGIAVTAGDEGLMPLITGRVEHGHAHCPQVGMFDVRKVVDCAGQKIGQDRVFGQVPEHVLQARSVGY